MLYSYDDDMYMYDGEADDEKEADANVKEGGGIPRDKANDGCLPLTDSDATDNLDWVLKAVDGEVEILSKRLFRLEIGACTKENMGREPNW